MLPGADLERSLFLQQGSHVGVSLGVEGVKLLLRHAVLRRGPLGLLRALPLLLGQLQPPLHIAQPAQPSSLSLMIDADHSRKDTPLTTSRQEADHAHMVSAVY